jgi:hypothetical protein
MAQLSVSRKIARIEELPGPREQRCHALIRAVLSRISREEKCKIFLILHPYCALQNPKPLK